jgi:hypothetical protein
MGWLIWVPKSLLDSQEIIKLLKDGSLLITLSDYSRNNQDIVRIERVWPCLSVVK